MHNIDIEHASTFYRHLPLRVYIQHDRRFELNGMKKKKKKRNKYTFTREKKKHWRRNNHKTITMDRVNWVWGNRRKYVWERMSFGVAMWVYERDFFMCLSTRNILRHKIEVEYKSKSMRDELERIRRRRWMPNMSYYISFVRRLVQCMCLSIYIIFQLKKTHCARNCNLEFFWCRTVFR